MKRRVSLIILVTFLGALSSLLALMPAQAQIDAFTYFIPFPADKLDDLFDIANNDNNFIDDNIVTTISIANQRDGTLIFYDHWEDNPEINLTSPVQASTEVWGDNNPANGIPPGFAIDVLRAGDIITLRSTVVLPRDPADIFFDGGDKFSALDGSLAVSLAVWPESADTLYAGAWGLLPNSDWGTEYIIPVGVDLATLRPGFGVASINVQAVKDNTIVQLDLDADNIFETTVTLDQGQQFTDISGTVNSGARILASAPVQAHLFTGNPTPGVNFEARAFTMIPRYLWTGDHLAPRSSDGDYWLYNPDPTTPLTVTVETFTNTVSLTIPANSTVQYPAGTLSSATGARFISSDGRPFAGVGALDEDSAQDWGYSLLPLDYLTTQVLIGWAPGNNTIGLPPTPPQCTPLALPLPPPPPPPGYESRIYVTAITTTTVNVDYDIDGVVDEIFPITPLSETYIVDPTDCDMTGAYLFTADDTPFITVWGQDEAAPAGQPSIDVGTAQIPLATLSIQKRIILIKDVDGSGAITWGDVVRFEIFTANNTNFLIDPAVITDTLPSAVDYITSTSTIRGSSIPDDTVGQTLFPFDEGGALIPNGLGPSEIVTATFDAVVKENVDRIENIACVDSPLVPIPECGNVEVPVQVPRLQMSKRRIAPVSGIANVGDVITFGVTITSTGNISITKLPLQDIYDPNHLTYRRAAPPPNLVTPGVITWNDLTTVFGPLPPGREISATVTFTANINLPPEVTKTINTAIITGAEGIDGSILPPLIDEAEVAFLSPPTPTPLPTSSPPPTDDDDDGGRPSIPSPTPQPPTVAPSPTVRSELPVILLPETGSRDAQTRWIWVSVFLLLTVSLTVIIIRSTLK